MRIVRLCYLAGLGIFLLPTLAFAYIDPGTGSLILQAIAAVAFSALAFWRGLREKIVNFFRRKK